jgi:hypothetical protein
MTVTPPQPGDVLAVRSGGWTGRLIRFGAALRDQPNLDSHIAVVHHRDAGGVLWVVEGRPGGVGWRDATAYLSSRWTLTNAAQPKTAKQRAAVCGTMTALITTGYDWAAITADAATDLGMHLPGWGPFWHGTVPGHVVCSSLAAYGYAKAGLACPPGERGCQPADWDTWILQRGWEQAPRTG